MPNVLVVDDSATDRGLAGGLLGKDAETIVTYATNGREALEALLKELPDVVVSDMQMPEMNGLELVAAMRADYPAIPVILMTARGSEEIAAEALRIGAAGYVPKVALAQHLRPAVERLIADAEADRSHSRLMHSLVSDDCTFELQNDPESFDAIVAHAQELLRCLPLGDESERLRVSVAIRHALWIAHVHGNLEVPISLDLTDDDLSIMVAERVSSHPYQDRQLKVQLRVSRDELVVSLAHQGNGISIDDLPQNVDEEAVDRSWLSRFILIPAVMDDVTFEDEGRSFRLLKKAISYDDLALE